MSSDPVDVLLVGGKFDQTPVEWLYRYTDHREATGMGFDGEYTGSRAAVSLIRYRVEKVTPKGRWIRTYGYVFGKGDRWVSNTSVKRYAYPTPDEAWQAFQHRKRRQLQIHQAALRHVQECLELAQPPV